jgi:hypothetical protein
LILFLLHININRFSLIILPTDSFTCLEMFFDTKPLHVRVE